MKTFDPRNMEPGDVHDVILDIILPRPIALISTVSEDGVYNLAPFSSITFCSWKPPLISFQVEQVKEGRKRDTQRNIEFTKDFVVNVTTESLAEAMMQSSSEYPPEVDEFKECGLTPVKSDVVKAPMLAESPINLECKVAQTLQFGELPSICTLIIGEVVLVSDLRMSAVVWLIFEEPPSPLLPVPS